ncbi:MAG: AAA family ATPase, partial [Merismopedia sp. SIO2A8]|nr:AAA family ATPase [Merismopedia sp. SIO2A8]
MDEALTSIPNYRLTEQLHEGSRTLVYRGRSLTDDQPVVIKLLKGEYPSFKELVQFRNQYAIAQHLDISSIVQPLRLEPYQNSYALIMADEGYISLKHWMGGKATSEKHSAEKYSAEKHSAEKQALLSVSQVLAIASQLADTLDGLYQHRVIHKDIKPANILIHPTTHDIKLADFSISSLLPKEQQMIQNPAVLEGTLAYIAPEQTGRMNRGIDYRADFYSLGVTLYELLTGCLPFPASDPMEIVHCHIAQPPPPFDSHPIPPAVQGIVLKLMAKNAEDRYQSALGLKHDLDYCLAQLETHETIQPFELGQQDQGDRFLIPEVLYGREQEVAELLAAFERVAGCTPITEETLTPPVVKSELMLVAGYSGVGKTAVINEVHKPIARQRGYFIRGKFDQFQRNIPFSAFVQAFRELMGQLLAESDIQLSQWKTHILDALGDNGQVIIDVIPELAAIIGPQPPVSELPEGARQNRFNRLFLQFIQVFTQPDHPLVLFLDDLQWADAASLQLMALIIGGDTNGYLLVLGAYRDNEVSPGHPFILTL